MAIYRDKKAGTWYFRIYVDDPLTGERKQISRKGFQLRRDAVDAEAITMSQYQNKEVAIDRVKFSDLLDEYYTFLKNDVKITTFVGYEYQIEKHIKPYFGNLRLRDLNKTVVEKWYEDIGKLKYTHGYKNKLLSRLSGLMKFADNYYGYRNRYINTLPNFKKQYGEFKREVVIFTEDDFNKFVSYAEDDLERSVLRTLFYTGVRIGELRGLKWTDIDLDERSISISRQVTSKVPGQPSLTLTPKSESSIRKIFIPNVLVNELRHWKTTRMKMYGYNEDWNVFGDRTHISENRIRRFVNRISKDSGMGNITLHQFRHSYTTMLHSMGVDPKIIQEQAGHSSVNITLDTYTHIENEQKQSAISDIFKNDDESS